MKVIVASVIFLEAIKYFRDFIVSLEQQDFHEFKILLINDNIPHDVLKKEMSCLEQSFLNRIILVDKQKEYLKPFELRIELLKEALSRNVELLILLDCDDKAKTNRISETVRQYEEEYAFFYNELFDFNGKRIMPDIPKITDNIETILECNYLGLSNCAINMKEMSAEFIESLREGQTMIFDWYLFSRILLNKKKGKKIQSTATYYRIYENNTVGIPDTTETALKKERNVKLLHYHLLEKYDKRYTKLIQKYEKIDIHSQQCKQDNDLQLWWNMLTDV